MDMTLLLYVNSSFFLFVCGCRCESIENENYTLRKMVCNPKLLRLQSRHIHVRQCMLQQFCQFIITSIFVFLFYFCKFSVDKRVFQILTGNISLPHLHFYLPLPSSNIINFFFQMSACFFITSLYWFIYLLHQIISPCMLRVCLTFNLTHLFFSLYSQPRWLKLSSHFALNISAGMRMSEVMVWMWPECWTLASVFRLLQSFTPTWLRGF